MKVGKGWVLKSFVDFISGENFILSVVGSFVGF